MHKISKDHVASCLCTFIFPTYIFVIFLYLYLYLFVPMSLSYLTMCTYICLSLCLCPIWLCVAISVCPYVFVLFDYVYLYLFVPMSDIELMSMCTFISLSISHYNLFVPMSLSILSISYFLCFPYHFLYSYLCLPLYDRCFDSLVRHSVTRLGNSESFCWKISYKSCPNL